MLTVFSYDDILYFVRRLNMQIIQWEFKYLDCNKLDKEGKKLGLEGWELVAVVNRGVDTTVLFKRPVGVINK